MKLRKVKPFWVVGLKARTDGRAVRDEAARLWFDLLDHGRMFRIKNRVNRTEYLTLFTEYESDAAGAFTVMAGQRVVEVDSDLEGLEALCIHGGEYIVFHARGEHPDAVCRTYEELDRYFASTTEFARLYTMDFQVSGKVWNETVIYIAVKPIAGDS